MKFPPMINLMLPFENQEVNASLREQAPSIRGVHGRLREKERALGRASQ